MKRAHVTILGKVQGVFFRAATQQAAKKFHLTGWVRNLPDGSVEAIFEGEDENIDKMLDWCHVGPPAAHVKDVLIKNKPYTGEFPDFMIRYR
jgi:acylphosphatase